MAVIFSNAVSSKEYEIATSSAAFEILSDGIYQHKEAAVIRELCTNAYDAHVSCGKQDIPFRVRLPSSLRPVFEVEDFGIGMSHEDVLNIYSSYFRSTKKQCLNSVGEKGLGSKTPLAISKSFNVRSRKDGVETLYSVVMSDGVPSVMTLNSTTCTTCNGTLVSVSVPSNMHTTFVNETRALLCTYKVTPIVEGLSDDESERFYDIVNYNKENLDETKDYNVVKIRSCNSPYTPAGGSPFNGSYLGNNGRLFVRLGPVIYPIGNDLTKFVSDMDEDDVVKIYNFFNYMDISVVVTEGANKRRNMRRHYNADSNYIVFNFNPKDLKTVTSRESVAMSYDNIKTIADRILSCASDFVDNIKNILDGSTNVLDAVRNVCEYGGAQHSVFKMAQKLDGCFTFKGKGILTRLDSRIPVRKMSIVRRYSYRSPWGRSVVKTEMDHYSPTRASLIQFSEQPQQKEMKIFYSDKYKSRRMASAVIRCVQQNKDLVAYSIEKGTISTEYERMKLSKLLSTYGVKHSFVKVEDYIKQNNVIWTQSTKSAPKTSSLDSCEGRLVNFKVSPEHINATSQPWAALNSVSIKSYNLKTQAKAVDKLYILSVASAKYSPNEVSLRPDKRGDVILSYLVRSDQFVKDVESGISTFSVFVPNKLEYKRLIKSGSLSSGNILDVTPIVIEEDTPEMIECLKTVYKLDLTRSKSVNYNFSGRILSQELLFDKDFLEMLDSCAKVSKSAKNVLTALLDLCKINSVRIKLLNDYCLIPYNIRSIAGKSVIETEAFVNLSTDVLSKYPLLGEVGTTQNLDHIKIYVGAVNMLKEESK